MHLVVCSAHQGCACASYFHDHDMIACVCMGMYMFFSPACSWHAWVSVAGCGRLWRPRAFSRSLLCPLTVGGFSVMFAVCHNMSMCDMCDMHQQCWQYRACCCTALRLHHCVHTLEPVWVLSWKPLVCWAITAVSDCCFGAPDPKVSLHWSMATAWFDVDSAGPFIKAAGAAAGSGAGHCALLAGIQCVPDQLRACGGACHSVEVFGVIAWAASCCFIRGRRVQAQQGCAS